MPLKFKNSPTKAARKCGRAPKSRRLKRWHLTGFAVLKEGCHETFRLPLTVRCLIFYMYEEYVYIAKFLWRIISTTGSGQNRLGMKPKAEPGGVRVRPDSAIDSGKKNISESLLNRILNCCWIVLNRSLWLPLNRMTSDTVQKGLQHSFPACNQGYILFSLALFDCIVRNKGLFRWDWRNDYRRVQLNKALSQRLELWIKMSCFCVLTKTKWGQRRCAIEKGRTPVLITNAV